jgi:hypothetical protein
MKLFVVVAAFGIFKIFKVCSGSYKLLLKKYLLKWKKILSEFHDYFKKQMADSRYSN